MFEDFYYQATHSRAVRLEEGFYQLGLAENLSEVDSENPFPDLMTFGTLTLTRAAETHRLAPVEEDHARHIGSYGQYPPLLPRTRGEMVVNTLIRATL